jgi:hypothetical protein
MCCFGGTLALGVLGDPVGAVGTVSGIFDVRGIVVANGSGKSCTDVPYSLAVIDIRIVLFLPVVVEAHDDGSCAVISGTVDAGLGTAMSAVSHHLTAREPYLTVNEVAMAEKFGAAFIRPVRVWITGRCETPLRQDAQVSELPFTMQGGEVFDDFFGDFLECDQRLIVVRKKRS